MPLAHLYGSVEAKVKGFEWLVKHLDPKNVIYIAIRDVDKQERQFIHDHNITYYSMDQVIELGIGEVMNRTTK